MKRLVSALFVLAVLAFVSSCSFSEPEGSAAVTKISRVECVMEDFEPDDATKVMTIKSGNNVSSTWEAGDVIGVFPDKGGDQVSFIVSAGAGTANCTFDGEGWGLIASAKYSAYYPYHTNNYGGLDAWKHIKVSYLGQSQGAKGTFGVGRYDFMACTNAVPSFADNLSGDCTFTFKHLGALLIFDVTFPASAYLSTLELVCESDVFTETGTVDLSQAQSAAAITASAMGNTLTLNLGGMAVSANETVRFYMMAAPCSMNGEMPTVRATTTSGAVMSKKLNSSYNFRAGRAYTISATLASETQPQEEVLSLSQDNFSIKYPFSEIQLNVTTNISYTISVTSGSDWVSISSYNRYSPSLEVKINNTVSARTATVLLKSKTSELSRTVTITQGCQVSGPVPVSHIMPCCRWNNDGTTFLVNNIWNSYHEYNDISQCRSILKTIAKAGIRVVCIDYTNQAQWDSQWESDNFKGRLDNIAQVCGEIGMDWFLFIGYLSISPGISWWNTIAERIWNSYAQLNHYHYNGGKPMLLIFMPGTEYNRAINNASAADKTYLKNGDKFTIGTCQVNSAITPTTTDGWGYRNYSQSSNGAVRFVCPNSGVPPQDWARIDDAAWASRLDWGLQATKYIVIGSYDDTCDAIFWGIADVSASNTAYHKHSATVNDPYVYYNIVRQKLIGE